MGIMENKIETLGPFKGIYMVILELVHLSKALSLTAPSERTLCFVCIQGALMV